MTDGLCLHISYDATVGLYYLSSATILEVLAYAIVSEPGLLVMYSLIVYSPKSNFLLQLSLKIYMCNFF